MSLSYCTKTLVAAMYEPVEIVKQENVKTVSTDPTPAEESFTHIDELLQQSSSNLNESQKECLRSLLSEYKDQFSKSSHLVEETIKTLLDCKPVKLRPYRIPLARREFAENKDPEYNGPYITVNDFSGRSVHTTTCLEPGVAEVLSPEMSHGMSKMGFRSSRMQCVMLYVIG